MSAEHLSTDRQEQPSAGTQPARRPSVRRPSIPRRSARPPSRRPSIPKDWIKLKKQVLVSVDRAETRVALLEASGTPAASRGSASERNRSAKSAATTARKRG